MGRGSIVVDERQLRLGLEAGPPGLAAAHLPFRVVTPGPEPFDDAGRFFEPWWPGTHACLRLEETRVRLETEHLVEADAAFPELAGVSEQVAAPSAVLEGTLMVLDGSGRPDGALLRRRLDDPADHAGEAAFVASDILALDGLDLAPLPFAERRGRLLGILADGRHAVASRGLRGEGLTLAAAVASLGMDAISARRLDAPWRPGPAGDAWLRLPVAVAPAVEQRPLLVVLSRLPLD